MNTLHYLPHHPVVKPTSNTTKVRIVYDASAKQSQRDLCLNDCLLRGPVIMPDLCQCLIRMRSQDIVIISDIEKAFMQVSLQPCERDVTRFLWFDDDTRPAIKDNLAVYRFRRVNFGIICSSFLLAVTIQHHLAVENTSFASSLKNCIYVDNVIYGMDKSGDPIAYYLELKSLFERAGMNIYEFCSNSKKLMEHLPKSDVPRSVPKDVRILGMMWDSQDDDTLRVCKSAKWKSGKVLTKRQVLHSIASVFDPLGMFQPVVVPGKLLLQSLWKQGAAWDDPLDSKLEDEWNDIRESIGQIYSVRLPRFTGSADSQIRLAVFSDASAKAYCAAVYMVSRQDGGGMTSNLIFAKTRLAPCSKSRSASSKVTLPRLELLGATIAAKAAEFC